MKRILIVCLMATGVLLYAQTQVDWTQIKNVSVNLATSVSGILPVANGGAGATTLTAHGVLMGAGTSAIAASVAGTSGAPFLSGGASANGAYGALNLAGGSSAVTGVLPAGNIATALSSTTSVNGTTIPSSSTLTVTVASGTVSLGTSTINSGACSSAIDGGTATGVAATDTIIATANADPTGVTGYKPATTGTLYVWAYPTSNHANFKLCNNTASNITPGSAVTLNWRVVR